MRRAIRAGIVVGLALALAGIPGSGSGQEESEVAAPKPTVPCEVSDPCADVMGAPSMEPEPEQAVVEDPGTQAHRDWVESIWNTP